MTPYLELNALLRNLICFWAILLILGFIAIVILSVRQKRRFYAAAATVSAFLLYFIMQVCRDISSWKLGYDLHPIAAKLGNLPHFVFILVLSVFTAALIIRFHVYMQYARTHITPTAVKEAADQNPTGLLYYGEDGQSILTNHRMNEISFAVTGRALLNAQEFYNAVKEKHICELPDGRVVRFSHKEFTFDGAPCHELIADDITELYRKTETLRRENERLQSQNERMKEYGSIIDETVRRQEVLNTKTRIHDEMNRLLLSTDNAIQSGTAEEQRSILETWQKNILLLCMEADTDRKNNALSDLDALAKVIGISIVYDKQPKTEDADTLRLFSLACEEAMTNAAKHGGAKNLYVAICEENDTLTASFTNDGKTPEGTFTEGGGLSALRQRIEQSGGRMQTDAKERFTLTVTIPKTGNRNVL